ncbi:MULTISPECIES: hypothetical protein [unclassified Flavobacterium]|jgi:hypothetical protein|uniref:hypothetical protein n=1 Tax=unclassified Flavobacterium TaxID=196869 RepID=UPI0025BD91A2|nr:MULTISPECIES: hypothetical protein [unclassified Flavobacterium]
MNKFLGIFILAIFSFSCSSNLDFNQVNNLKLEPVFVANLASFDVSANQFVTNGAEQDVFLDVANFDVFKDSFFDKSLKKAELFFEINNTINRAYSIDLVLLDVNDTPLYTIPFNVPAYSGAENLVTKTEIFENNNLVLLKSTTKIAFTITMLTGPPLSESSLGSLKMRSSATVYLVVR